MKLSIPLYLSALTGCNAWTNSPVGTNILRTRNVFSPSATSLHSSTATNDFNVVLRPSDNPDAFDNLKIGAAKVHRYARDTEDGAEYIMWYHGRNEGFDKDGLLPPLSTGRIGRATSRNGLHWVREEIGSASEDVNGVSLGLNTESWWGFDTAHVGLGQVMLPMSTPAVMTEVSESLWSLWGGVE